MPADLALLCPPSRRTEPDDRAFDSAGFGSFLATRTFCGRELGFSFATVFLWMVTFFVRALVLPSLPVRSPRCRGFAESAFTSSSDRCFVADFRVDLESCLCRRSGLALRRRESSRRCRSVAARRSPLSICRRRSVWTRRFSTYCWRRGSR